MMRRRIILTQPSLHGPRFICSPPTFFTTSISTYTLTYTISLQTTFITHVTSRPREVAFIFEDDIEVSPLYFHWSEKALQQYYRCAPGSLRVFFSIFVALLVLYLVMMMMVMMMHDAGGY